MTYQRHPLDIGSLVLGLVFLGGVAAWGLFELGVVDGDDAAWLLPVVLIGAGVLGIALTVTKERRGRREHAVTETPYRADDDPYDETHQTQPIPQERHDD